LDVGPLADAGADIVADLEHDVRDVTLVEMSCGSEADRTGADDGDRQVVGADGVHGCVHGGVSSGCG
jgi:hypothetical protein